MKYLREHVTRNITVTNLLDCVNKGYFLILTGSFTNKQTVKVKSLIVLLFETYNNP